MQQGKIMHVIGQMIRGGAERQLLLISEALAKRGWSQSVVIFNAGDAWEGEFAKFGVPVHIIPRHPIKPWRLLQMNLLSAREHADILHSWSWHTNVYAGVSLPLVHPKRVLSFRNNPMADNQTGQARDQLPNANIYSNADCIISNSRAAFSSLSGVKLRRQELVGNIVTAYGRAQPGQTPAKIRLATAGALKPAKAYDYLLRALAILKQEGANFELLMAGSGSHKEELEALASELDLSDCVQFLGQVADVPALFSTVQMVIHPSRNEGLSNTILEAMAEGLPVVACPVGDNPEIIEHDITGLLVPVDNVEALAAQIRRLLDDPDLRARLGAAALALVRERFNHDTVARQYEAIYNALLES